MNPKTVAKAINKIEEETGKKIANISFVYQKKDDDEAGYKAARIKEVGFFDEYDI